MADAIFSPLADRLTNFILDEIHNEVNLVSGVKKKVNKLSDELKTIRLFLDDAERQGYKNQIIKHWLWRLEDASYEMDDVLDEWELATIQEEEVTSRSSCLCFKNVSNDHRIGKKIKDVTAKLDDIFKEKDRYNLTKSESTNPTCPAGGSWRGQSTSFVKINEIRGRDCERDNLLKKVLEGGSPEQESAVHVISLVGLGGIGKTTLAQFIYNDKQVKDCYPFRIWICVSDPFDEAGIAKGIIEKVQGSSPEACQLDMLLERLKSCISGKKFLLVMDDVWTEDDAKWGPLKNCLESGGLGSKILVTTRKRQVAITMGTMSNDIHNVGRLSDEDCWLLLSQVALHGKSPSEHINLEALGKRIAKKCNGLPLAAKALGSLLRFKYTADEWENVVNSEIWEIEQAEIDVFPHLLLSYNELSPNLKRCFSYCAVFPKDFNIRVKDLIQSWTALGYLGIEGDLDLRGKEYFDNLAMRSLFQDFKMNAENNVILECKVHDIVHDFAIFLRKNSSENKVKANCDACNPSLVSHVKKYRSLFCKREHAPNICGECMVNVRVLSVVDCGLKGFPMEVEKLIHLRYLNLSRNSNITGENMKMICKLYNLKALNLYQCNLQEIPREIGNLIRLRDLNLGNNESLELPESICDLRELRSLCLMLCSKVVGLPSGIHRLEKLKHLNLRAMRSLKCFPEDVGLMIHLCTLNFFNGRLSYLKKLNKLSGRLELVIANEQGERDVVKEAKGAELSEKVQIQQLELCFKINDQHVSMAILDALEPHRNLNRLDILFYKGFKLPDWISSPINQVKHICLYCFRNLLQLPPLGKLSCLKTLTLWEMEHVELVGRELLGITESRKDNSGDVGPSSPIHCTTVAFPVLERLEFIDCRKWKEWEDITAEEQNSTTVSCFPNLKYLQVSQCKSLKALPHGLLRKATKLEELSLSYSDLLLKHYDQRKEDSAWKFISHIPHVTCPHGIPMKGYVIEEDD